MKDQSGWEFQFEDDDVEEITWEKDYNLMKINTFHDHLSFYHVLMKATNDEYNKSDLRGRRELVRNLYSDLNNMVYAIYENTPFEKLYIDEGQRKYGHWNIVSFMSMDIFDKNVLSFLASFFKAP